MEKSLYGPNPLDGENSSIEFSRLLRDIKKKVFAILEKMKSGKVKNPDNGFIAYIFALNLLGAQKATVTEMSIYSKQVKEWEQAYLEWFESVETKIPKKFREELKENALKQLRELAEKGSNMPRDMWD